jgi:hypothetical protein
MFNNHVCSIKTTMLLLGVAIFGFSVAAKAQITPEHGAGISKACGAIVRTCDADADCADDDECSENLCDTTNPRTLYNCTFTIRNFDGFGDSLRVTDAIDTIKALSGNVVVPAGRQRHQHELQADLRQLAGWTIRAIHVYGRCARSAWIHT